MYLANSRTQCANRFITIMLAEQSDMPQSTVEIEQGVICMAYLKLNRYLPHGKIPKVRASPKSAGYILWELKMSRFDLNSVVDVKQLHDAY